MAETPTKYKEELHRLVFLSLSTLDVYALDILEDNFRRLDKELGCNNDIF